MKKHFGSIALSGALLLGALGCTNYDNDIKNLASQLNEKEIQELKEKMEDLDGKFTPEEIIQLIKKGDADVLYKGITVEEGKWVKIDLPDKDTLGDANDGTLYKKLEKDSLNDVNGTGAEYQCKFNVTTNFDFKYYGLRIVSTYSAVTANNSVEKIKNGVYIGNGCDEDTNDPNDEMARTGAGLWFVKGYYNNEENVRELKVGISKSELASGGVFEEGDVALLYVSFFEEDGTEHTQPIVLEIINSDN